MTPEAAKDAMLDVFKAAWDTTGFPAVYDDKPGNKPTSETVWARATIQHGDSFQSSIAGAAGQRRYTDTGFVFVQVFAPVGDGSTACLQAAQLVRNAYQDSRHPNVWFRNVRLKEVTDKGAFVSINVEAAFSYDDVR